MRKTFDYTLDYKSLDLRKDAALYRVGKGEQGVLLVEPYKSEILPHWKFKTVPIAKKSAAALKKLFVAYKKEKDFVGMDMTRKFIQMGFTRSRRYANHSSGKKYAGAVPADKKGQSGAHGRLVLPRIIDKEKAAAAEIFKTLLQKINADPIYLKMKSAHIAQE